MIRRLVFRGLSTASLALCLAFATFLAPAQSEYVDVVFDFTDGQESYAPGENFTVLLTVTNSYGNFSENIYTITIAEISAYFSWMGPNEWNTSNLSPSAITLYPDEMRSFAMTYPVPDNATAKAYSYKFKVSSTRRPASTETSSSHCRSRTSALRRSTILRS